MSKRIEFLILTLAPLSWLILPVGSGQSLPAGENDTVERRLVDGITFLASDELKGRGIGTPELDQAAEFIHREFATIGLETQIYEDGPYQRVELSDRVRLGLPEDNRLTFRSSEPAVATVHGQLDQDFRPLAIGGSKGVELPLVFAGFGITAPEFEYDDYRNLDVQGKAVIVIRKEPQQGDRDSKFKGRANTKHAYFRAKIENAVAHEAAAVLLVNDGPEIEKRTNTVRNRWNRKLKQVTREQQRFEKLSDPEGNAFQKHREYVARLVSDLRDIEARVAATDPLLQVDGAGVGAVDSQTPVFFCSRKLIDQVLQQSLQTNLAECETRMDNLQPASAALPNWSVDASSRLEPVSGRNVIAMLPAEGDLADETVLVGAHYDHVGMGGAGSLAPWTRAVHNGADDNASGVVALLEVARQLAARSEPLRRRVVFIAFTAEELGLLGSAHYVRDPRFPLSKTVAMLNLDMVGRLGDAPLTIQGRDTAAEFEVLLDAVTSRHDLNYRHKKGGAGPSDHAVFFREGIPVMHFFTGVHRDYHRPSDDVEKIDSAGLRRICDVVAEMTAEIANAEVRPTFRKSIRSGSAQ